MEFLSHLLPIFIYILLIILIVVFIILGIKVIITIDKVTKVVDDVNENVEKVTPIFNTIGLITGKFSNGIEMALGFIENIITKLFARNDKKERESENDG